MELIRHCGPVFERDCLARGLAYLVELDPEDAPSGLVILEGVMPADAIVDRWSTLDPPANGRSVIPPVACQSLGDVWIAAGSTLAVSVPPVVLPSE
jgi:hypothetical protein